MSSQEQLPVHTDFQYILMPLIHRHKRELEPANLIIGRQFAPFLTETAL